MANSANIGLQFALDVELNAYLTASRKAGFRVEFAGNHVVVDLGNSKLFTLASGIGLQNALRASEILADMGVFCIISSGIAGALDRRLCSGDIVVAKRVLSEARQGYGLVNCDPVIISLATGGGRHYIGSGDIVSSRHVVRTPEERARMYAATGAVAVDMESYAVGRLCKKKGLKFAVIRAVADTYDDNLTGVFKDTQASPSLLGFAKQLACRPSSVPRFVRLYSQVVLAVRQLAEFLVWDLFRKCPEGRCHQ
ncbi:MAG: phosphorylase family protein [Armatimonadota bacterium]